MQPPPTTNPRFVQPDQTSLFPALLRVDVKDIRTDPENTILENDKTYLYRHNDCAVSLRRDINVVEKEIGRMLELAPLGIAIPVVGIVFEETVIDGYIMPLARAVPSDLDVSTKREYTS
jgi:hypothetical protein